MRKVIHYLVLFAICLCLSVPVIGAENQLCGTSAEWTLENGVLTVSGSGAMADYSSPQDAPWYSRRDEIESVIIEQGITSVGSRAFAQCENLAQISLPQGLTAIGNYAFWGCSALSGITLPDSLDSLGQGAFFRCSSLTEIWIPEEITVLPRSVFGQCERLDLVVLHDQIRVIEQDAFSRCYSLRHLALPVELRSIGKSAFFGCAQLSELTFPEKVEQIGMAAFYGCVNLATLQFVGDAPAFDEKAFSGYSGTACYPMDNATWSEDVLQDYGGTITWKAIAPPPAVCQHQWCGGICIHCGAYYVVFQTATISLAGNIALNFYLELGEAVLSDENACMRFTLADGTVRTAMLSNAKTSVKDGITRYIFTCELHAKQMADPVIAQMYLSDGTPVGGSKQYSVVTYAGYIIANEDVYTPHYPTLIPLLKAMLNYGTYSQIHFGYNMEHPANAGLGLELEDVTVDQVSAYKPKTAGSLTGLKAASVTLILRSETVLRFYFNLSEGYNINDYRFTLAGKSVQPQYNPDNGRYYVEVTNIAAKNLDQAYGVSVTNADGTESLSVVASAMSYVYQVLANPGYFTQDLKDLVKAIHAYATAANGYFV